MKTKVISLLKPKCASLGFTTEELDGVCENISKTLKEDATDEQIGQAIDAVLPFLQMSQKAATRIVNAEKEKSKKERDEEARKKATEEEAAKKAKENGVGNTDDEPAWFQSYRNSRTPSLQPLKSKEFLLNELLFSKSWSKNCPKSKKPQSFPPSSV